MYSLDEVFSMTSNTATHPYGSPLKSIAIKVLTDFSCPLH